MHLYPLRWATRARPTPVLPEVGSTIVPPGRRSPRSSASSIIFTAMRSLTEPPGFMYSILASTVALIPSVTEFRRTRGVWPTRSTMCSAYFTPRSSHTPARCRHWLPPLAASLLRGAAGHSWRLVPAARGRRGAAGHRWPLVPATPGRPGAAGHSWRLVPAAPGRPGAPGHSWRLVPASEEVDRTSRRRSGRIDRCSTPPDALLVSNIKGMTSQQHDQRAPVAETGHERVQGHGGSQA